MSADTGTHEINSHTCRQNAHTHKIKINLLFKNRFDFDRLQLLFSTSGASALLLSLNPAPFFPLSHFPWGLYSFVFITFYTKQVNDS